MSRQLRGNGCALLPSFQCEYQQNSSDETRNDNIRKIPMNAVLPCLHSLDGHYRRMGQALARGEGNQGAVGGRLFGSQQQKGPSAINQLKNIGPRMSSGKRLIATVVPGLFGLPETASSRPLRYGDE